MYSALIEKLGQLPDNTRVFCGHEYTVQNLKFAKYVEGDNQDILKKLEWSNDRRKKGLPTVVYFLITVRIRKLFLFFYMQ